MLSLEMLDVAIGIIFVYLLISLICTAINEMVEAKLKLRAVDLEQGIRVLLNNDAELTEKIYNHPLIDGLFRGKYKISELRKSKKSIDTRYSRGSDLPSYIPSKNFSLALINIFLPSLLNNSKPVDSAALQNDINGIINLNVKKIVTVLAATTGNDINKIREGIEGWYNSSMDRVSGWYKRRVQKIIFVLGFIIVLLMNADSIAIFNNLVNDRPLRSSITDAAQRMPATATPADNTSTSKIKANIDSLYQLGLPIGWRWKSDLHNTTDAVSNLNAIPAFTKNDIGSCVWLWFLKIVGWFITAFAISLGAPFWFDVLNRVMVVRSTVKPTEKKP